MQAWYLVTTKLKSELRVKDHLKAKHDLDTFFPTFPAKKANSRIGLPLFARYVFVNFDLERDFHKVNYTPGVTKIVNFGATFVPVEDDVITCLRHRCDDQDIVLSPDLIKGQKVRVKQGIFEGCEGIISEKRGNRRVQLLLEMAFDQPNRKVELASGEVEPIPVG